MVLFAVFFFFKQKTAYEMRISDWSSDVCSSDLTYPTIRENPIVIHSSKHPLAVFVVTPLALALAAASAQAATRVDLQKQDVAALNSQYAKASVAIGVSKRANLRHAEPLSLGPDSRVAIGTDRDIAAGPRTL